MKDSHFVFVFDSTSRGVIISRINIFHELFTSLEVELDLLTFSLPFKSFYLCQTLFYINSKRESSGFGLLV
jgi:hypothetical protein